MENVRHHTKHDASPSSRESCDFTFTGLTADSSFATRCTIYVNVSSTEEGGGIYVKTPPSLMKQRLGQKLAGLDDATYLHWNERGIINLLGC